MKGSDSSLAPASVWRWAGYSPPNATRMAQAAPERAGRCDDGE